MTIPFFKNLYKVFASQLSGQSLYREKSRAPLFIFGAALLFSLLATITLQAFSPEQELKACKSALLAQLNEEKRHKVSNCPISEKLIFWMGILKKPEQFTPPELITFVETHPHWPHYDKLCKKTEYILSKKGNKKEILTWFEKHPPQTPEGVIAYATTLLSCKSTSKATKVITTAWATMEMTHAEEKKFLRHFAYLLSKSNHNARLQFFLWEEDIPAAKRFLVHVSPPARKVAEIRLALLEGRTFQKIPFPNEEGLLYEAVKYYKKNKDWANAAKLLLHTPSSKVYAEKWWKLRNYVAREFIALRDYKNAYHILKKHNLDPGTESFAEAEWLLGWLALRFLNASPDAQRHFETFSKHVKAAISKARAAYWLGRTHEKKKELALAEKYYRKAAYYKTTYYGQLSAIKLREKPYPILKATSKATVEEKKRFNQKDLVRAAYILKGLGKDAAHELSKFLSPIATQAKTKAERELAVQLAHSLSPCDVVWVAKRAGNHDPVLLRIAYPVCSLPKRQDLPEKALLLAIAYKESHFNSKAQSPKGATGLLQLMPQAAADAAKRLGVFHTENKLFDPRHNLLLGSDHVSSLLGDFNHSYLLVAAAYNAGPTPVGRWLRNFGHPHQGEVDVVDWIELIPYPETRNYVQRVLENVTNYRSLQATPTKTLIDDLRKRT